MRAPNRIFLIALLFGLALWVLDSILDSLIFYRAPFLDLLILNVPPQEIYMRVLIVACFAVFGWLAAGYLSKIERAENRLRRVTDTIQPLLNATTDIVLVLTKTGYIRLANVHGAQFLGITPEDAVGKLFFDLLPPDVAKQRQEKTEEVVRIGKPVFFEDEVNGAVFDNSLYPIVHPDGIERVAVFARDITQAKRTKEERDRLFNLSLDMMCIGDLDGWLRQVNPAFTETLGWSSDELKAKRWLDFVHPDDRAAAIEALKQLAAGEPVRSFENRYLCKDGTYRWLSWNSFPRPAEETVFAVSRDVTKRKEAQEAIRRSEATLNSIFRVAPIGIGMVRDRVIAWVNRRFCEMTGYEEHELIGQSARIVYPSDAEYERVGRVKYEDIRREGTGSIETRLCHKDGRIMDILLNSTPMDMDDWSVGVTFTALDITEQKLNELYLKESEAKFRNVFLSSPLGMLMYQLQPDGRLVLEDVNPAADEILRIDCRLLVGKTIEQAFPGLAQTEVSGRYREAAANGISWQVTELYYAHGDIDGWFDVQAFQTSPGIMVAAFSDVTDRVTNQKKLHDYRNHLEELVRERTEELEKAQEELVRRERLAALGQLTATVSHEIRNPLGTIRTAVFSICDAIERNQPHRVDRALKLAERNIIRCDRIIEELLDFTRIREINPVPTDADKWIAEALKEESFPDNIQLTVDLSSGATVNMDRQRMLRALINVTGNALHALQDEHAHDSRLTIISRCAGDNVLISVADTGPGIPDEMLSHIFEPLFSTKGFGVGLGLPIVRNIARQHGGDVDIQSQVGKGATVTLRLPVLKP